MARTKSPAQAALEELRAFGLTYPGAHLKSPWPDHKDLAVNDKTFAYLNETEPFGISCKLPESNSVALSLPFTEPTGYGLGKSGWVNASLPAGEAIPIELFKAWIDESYRAQAPKKLVAQLNAGAGKSAPVATKQKVAAAKKKKPAATKKKPAAKKPATKKRAGKR